MPLLAAPAFAPISAAQPTVERVKDKSAPKWNFVAKRIALGTLGGNHSWARAVDGDIVVGASGTIKNFGPERAFAYDLGARNPKMIDLGTLGGEMSAAYDVDGSVVVGSAQTEPEGSSHAFVYDLSAASPRMVDLGTLGGRFSNALAVQGTLIAGTSETAAGNVHGFVYDLAEPDVGMVDLGTLGGDTSLVKGVDGTVVVGSSTLRSGEMRAFAYDLSAVEPRMVDLGTLGGSESAAHAIDGTLIAGTSRTSTGYPKVFAYDMAAPNPTMAAVADLTETDYQAPDVDGSVIVGTTSSHPPATLPWLSSPFAVDLDDPDFSFGRVASRLLLVDAIAISRGVVVGRAHDYPASGGHIGYALDLRDPAARPVALTGAGKRGALTIDGIDGNVVVGTAKAEAGKNASHATAWVLRKTKRPTFSLRERIVNVGEGQRVVIKVDRYGRTDRADSVRYRTEKVPLTPGAIAEAGRDYKATSGKLRFGPGVTTRRVVVKIYRDDKREKEQRLFVRLRRPSESARLGFPALLQLNIEKNDT